MVFVKVRETYDLHTTQNKMTVIGIHTPLPDIIKKNYPGLLMQCKMYRPVSCDVRIACASVLPLDPQGVGTGVGDVAPEDVFNPILYKAMTNVGMSQLEARINALSLYTNTGADVTGQIANVDVNTVTEYTDEFPVYYGLLSHSHGWKKANPQSGLEMTNLIPLVHEVAYNIGDNYAPSDGGLVDGITAPVASNSGDAIKIGRQAIISGTKPLPWINCTAWSGNSVSSPSIPAGFPASDVPTNAEQYVPWINCLVAAIIVPPSRMHELFYRMVCEWTIEFSSVRPIGEITSLGQLAVLGNTTHYQNYSYSAAKAATVGEDVPDVLTHEAAMVSANVDIDKVM